MILLVGSLALLAFICYATNQSARLLRRVRVEGNLLLSPPENAVRLLFIVAAFAIAKASGEPSWRFGFEIIEPWVDIGVGLGFGIGAEIIIGLTTLWAIGRFGRNVYSPLVVLNILPKDRTEWVLVAIALLPAALLEELLFRSLLVGGFSVFINPLLPALAFSIIFGLMHAPQGPLGIVTTAAVGFLLSLLFIWRWSLLAPLVAHYAINLLSLVIASRQRPRLESYLRPEPEGLER